ncbi:invertebrate-type lysozyme 3-like [Schistocerca gregaria]|uniref:invertebrate-type lysozyme 3-like n=1 Tax=Schistocerca gregaria TaxID=7010 RepID=UPI00211E703E|nr:invertebrate-type lysozyme 3-like [Schistocerca gregaria]
MANAAATAVFVAACLGSWWALAAGQLSQECLGCICEAASGCDVNSGCNGDVCGPFKITWAFWADAGKPVISGDNANSDGAYVRCSSDVYCAASAVGAYMSKYATDCNGDGQIDCFDYAAIHRLGKNACNGQIDLGFQNRFLQCQNALG